jgi:hypothetical protein
MDRPKALALTFPLLQRHSPVKDALEQARQQSAGAVVSTDGKEFWLHKLSDLTREAEQNRDTPLSSSNGRKVPVLSTAETSNLALDLTKIDEDGINSVFQDTSTDVVITSVVSNFEGDRLVVALTNPRGLFKIAGKVWKCPKDGEKFSSPGKCPKHNMDLVAVP